MLRLAPAAAARAATYRPLSASRRCSMLTLHCAIAVRHAAAASTPPVDARPQPQRSTFAQPAAQQPLPPQRDAASAEAQGATEPLWPNCDTVKEILEEEKYGSSDPNDADGQKPPDVEPEHVVLAFRALV
jgi:hypothetical protein